MDLRPLGQARPLDAAQAQLLREARRWAAARLAGGALGWALQAGPPREMPTSYHLPQLSTAGAYSTGTIWGRLPKPTPPRHHNHTTTTTPFHRYARWEFEGNHNVEGARVMLQRGLRLNPGDQSLYLYFAKVELE